MGSIIREVGLPEIKKGPIAFDFKLLVSQIT